MILDEHNHEDSSSDTIGEGKKKICELKKERIAEYMCVAEGKR